MGVVFLDLLCDDDHHACLLFYGEDSGVNRDWLGAIFYDEASNDDHKFHDDENHHHRHVYQQVFYAVFSDVFSKKFPLNFLLSHFYLLQSQNHINHRNDSCVPST